MKKYIMMLLVAMLGGAISSAGINSLTSSRADQSERVPPTAGIYTGVQFSQLIGDAMRSVSTGNKGSTAPANVGSSVVDGLEWIDDSSTPWIKKRYVNGGWAVEGALNPTDSTYVGVIGGGVASLASATTTDLGSVPQANVTITGTTTITGFGSSAPTGVVKIIRFDGALTLTYSSALPVPTGGYDLLTAANDRAIVTHLGSGNWEITQYTRANGIPIDASAVGKMDFGQFASAPTNHVLAYGQALTRTSYPAYVAKVTRAQNGTRTSGNATITSVANTDGFGVGMPVESTGVNAGCTIASFVANTSVTLNSAGCVTASGTSTMTVFLTGYGTGGSSSTVGVQDCRGRAIAGRDHNAPGSYAATLSTTYAGTNARAFNTAFGSESQTLTLAQLPTGITAANAAQAINVSSSYYYPGINQANWAGISMPTVGGSTQVVPYSGGVSNAVTSINSMSGTNSISVTSNNTSGNAHPIVPPTLTAECIVRVTP